MKRSFLFLQGCTSPFFTRLGDRLLALGHQIYRINFNMGDAVYWGVRPAWNYRYSSEHLADYLEERFKSIGFTDIITLGDTRPVNRPAIALAKRYNLKIHVLEEGYFRPNWLTLEENGINGYSLLPKDPEWYRLAGKTLPDQGDGYSVKNPISLLALHEVAYHLPNLLNPLFYPGYQTHRPHISGIELFGWAKRFAKTPYWRQRDSRTIKNLLHSKQNFYLFPLQLNSDSQIQEHSATKDILFTIKKVLNSFSRYAPANSILVIKNHPLDTGFIDYVHWIKRLQHRLNLQDRIIYIESGHLPTLLEGTQGVVTINSSVGTSALFHRCPTIALGKAIYDIPGLTFQGNLDQFWNNLQAPDRQLFVNFRKIVIHTAQINGGFYSPAGIALGVENCCQRFEMQESPLEKLLKMTH